ncbi:HlyD family efflux transporter periplasmic adaptor subunit [soil metagenome]
MPKLTLKIFTALFAVLLLTTACMQGNKDEQAKMETVTVELQPRDLTLYFAGIIQPIAVNSVTSPADGTIKKLFFGYGQLVKKGQLLLSINSSGLDTEYQGGLTAYLSAKEKYFNSKRTMEGTEELKAAGLISANEYINNKSSLNDSYLSYIQAQYKLLQVLKKIHMFDPKLAQLDIGDTVAVDEALTRPVSELEVYASADGIALMPQKSGSSGGGGGGDSMQVGSQIKVGEVVVAVGDMSGISLDIKINEVDINQVKVGDKASISSPAFPRFVLKGMVTSIMSQASSESGNLPTFPVKIIVPKLSSEERKLIHVGMSAKIALTTKLPSALMVPLGAVLQQDNNTYVEVVDSKTGKINKVTVKTGRTTQGSVAIMEGLRAGDKIVVRH